MPRRDINANEENARRPEHLYRYFSIDRAKTLLAGGELFFPSPIDFNPDFRVQVDYQLGKSCKALDRRWFGRDQGGAEVERRWVRHKTAPWRPSDRQCRSLRCWCASAYISSSILDFDDVSVGIGQIGVGCPAAMAATHNQSSAESSDRCDDAFVFFGTRQHIPEMSSRRS